MSQDRWFHGKVALVTGSGRGLGREYALHLARLGCDVAIHDIDHQAPAQFGEAESLEQTVGEIRALGRRSMAVTADLTRDDEVQRAVHQVNATLGKIDFLINNAGGDIGRHTPRPEPNGAVDVRAEDAEWVIAVNLTATIHACRAVVPLMIKQQFGRIINVSSVAALQPVTEGVVYAAAKAGIIHYTRCLAKELRSKNINVNAIAPGPTIGGRFLATRHVPAELLERKEGLNRLAWPTDQAKVIEFLLSPLGDYVSGQTIAVDGGAW